MAPAIFPDGNQVKRLHDDLHMVVADRDFADLFPAWGQPAEAPVRLALATLLQFMEGLTDRQAADSIRPQIDWKYLLCFELTDTGFAPTVLSEFRTRLLTHGTEGRLFEAILRSAREHGLLKGGGRQRSDPRCGHPREFAAGLDTKLPRRVWARGVARRVTDKWIKCYRLAV